MQYSDAQVKQNHIDLDLVLCSSAVFQRESLPSGCIRPLQKPLSEALFALPGDRYKNRFSRLYRFKKMFMMQ
jgi:hypothetical protein